MADRILNVQTIVLSQSTDLLSPSGSGEIIIPSPTALRNSWGAAESEFFPGDVVTYIFDGSNLVDLEFCHSGATQGIKILASTEKTTGPWRLIAAPPNFIYLPTSGSTSVRVTTVLGR